MGLAEAPIATGTAGRIVNGRSWSQASGPRYDAFGRSVVGRAMDRVTGAVLHAQRRDLRAANGSFPVAFPLRRAVVEGTANAEGSIPAKSLESC